MTAKKRARNRNNKKARAAAAAAAAAQVQAVAAERPPTTAATNFPQAKRDPLDQQLNLQMQRLQTDDSPLRNDDTKEKEDMCMHGLMLRYANEKLKETIMRLCDDAVSADYADIQKVFVGTASAHLYGGHHPLTTIIDGTMANLSSLYDKKDSGDDVPDDIGIIFTLLLKHPEFGEDPIHIEWIVSHFLSEGTQCMLRGDIQAARGNAYFANFFEQCMILLTEGKMMNASKLMKSYNADEHTLCSFFRNRIPCSCLNEKYKEVKSLTKKDICWNIDCSQPDRFEVDNKSMMCCSRCRQASYCCSKCQEIDWPRHKKNCGLARDMGVIFGAQNMDELENNKVWTRAIAPHMSKEIELLKKAGKNTNPFKRSNAEEK